MIDIDSWRKRIGCFTGRHTRVRNMNLLLQSERNLSFSFKLCFLFAIGLAALCVRNDPSVARNPGPPKFVKFPYHTITEEKAFLSVRKLNEEFANISSHLSFIKNCRRYDIIPKGIIIDFPVVASKPNESLLDSVKNISE